MYEYDTLALCIEKKHPYTSVHNNMYYPCLHIPSSLLLVAALVVKLPHIGSPTSTISSLLTLTPVIQ